MGLQPGNRHPLFQDNLGLSLTTSSLETERAYAYSGAL